MVAHDGLTDSASPVDVQFNLKSVDDRPILKPEISGKFLYNVLESTDSVINLLTENLDSGVDEISLEFAPNGNPSGQFSLVKEDNSNDQWKLKFSKADAELPGSSKPAQQAFTASVIAFDVNDEGERGLELLEPLAFTVRLDNDPDQILGLSAVGAAQTLLVTDTSIDLDLDYKVRAASSTPTAGPDGFTATLTHDSALVLASDTLDSGLVQISNTLVSGPLTTLTLTGTDLSSLTPQNKALGKKLGSLKFLRADHADDPSKPIDPGSYSFNLDLNPQDGFEALTDSIVISPNVDNFIGLYSPNVFNLVDFDTPLTVDTKTKTVTLNDPSYGGFSLDYLNSTTPFDALKLTSKNDTLLLDHPLTVLLEDGDDTINFQPLATFANSFGIDASLGKGDDTVVLPSEDTLDAMVGRSQEFNVNDFELGFDAIQTPNGLKQRRDQVIDFVQKKAALDFKYAPVAINLDQKDASLASIPHKVFSEATPLITSSIALDPGSAKDTVQLEVKLVDPTNPVKLVLLNDGSSTPAWSWSVPADDVSLSDTASHTALLSFNSGSGVTPLQAQAQLRKAAANIGLQTTSESAFTTNLQVQWKSTGDVAPRDVLTKEISVQASIVPVTGAVDYADSVDPLNLTLSLSNVQGRELTSVHASSKADRIVLISEAFNDAKTDSVYANQGNDLVEVGDGDAAHGEFGDDRLIAMAGSSTTQLFGGRGHDLLIGAEGDDLFAGKGNDVLAVRGNRNFLWGGDGSDTFVLHDDSIHLLNPGTGLSRVKDFNTSDDLINIHASGVDKIAHLSLTAFGRRSTKIALKSSVNHSLGSDSFAIIENVRPGQLTESNFVFTQNSLVADNLSRVAAIDQFI